MAAFRAAEPKGVPFEAQWALDEAFSTLAGRHDRAVARLILAPAPDLPAFALKLALAVDQQAWELPEGEEALAALKSDAARLCV
jgi:hypothetical protein